MAGLLEVGRIARAHGLSGEVLVNLVTNRLERVAVGTVLHAEPKAGPASGPAAPARELRIVASRPHLGGHLVVFDGVSTRESAEELHGWRLLAAPVEGACELFVHELIGADLYETSGQRRGTVTAVEANPASDLLVVDDRWYVPLRFVTEHSAGRVVVAAPEGLFE